LRILKTSGQFDIGIKATLVPIQFDEVFFNREDPLSNKYYHFRTANLKGSGGLVASKEIGVRNIPGIGEFFASVIDFKVIFASGVNLIPNISIAEKKYFDNEAWRRDFITYGIKTEGSISATLKGAFFEDSKVGTIVIEAAGSLNLVGDISHVVGSDNLLRGEIYTDGIVISGKVYLDVDGMSYLEE